MRDMNKPEPKGEMKVRRFRTIVLVAGLVLCAVSAQAESWREFQITDTPELWETRCDVSGNIVVWSIVGDVLAADITDPNEPEIFVVAGSEYSEGSPMISGRNVVWRRSVGRNGNIIAGTIRDITPGRGGPTKTVDSFAVTTDSTIDDAYPDIDDEWVVWTQDRPDVYGYDIACARLSDGRVASTYVVAMTGDLVFAPRISGALIVWSEDNSNDALGANISDPQNPLPFEVGLPTETCGGRELAVCIDGPWALWAKDGGPLGDTLYADNIFDPYPPLQLAQGGVSGLLGGIAENIVVWEELVGWQTTIYGYNLATNTKFPIVEDVTTSGFPIAISADREPGRFVVVWGDNRTGVTDLYGMILDGPLVAGCASYAPADLNHDCRVDGLDLALLAEDWLASSQVVNPLDTEDDADDDDTEKPDDSEPSRSR